MKFNLPLLYHRGAGVAPPSRGAWIEIFIIYRFLVPSWSPPSRGAWIEMENIAKASAGEVSPPSRGAWIEIRAFTARPGQLIVAPLAGGVD